MEFDKTCTGIGTTGTNSSNSETIEILYNDCYGGFSLSDEAVKLYQMYTGKTIDKYTNDVNTRMDPILIRIYYEILNRINGSCANICTHSIKRKYMKHIHIHEYDGMESVEINMEQYKLDKIKEVINNNDDISAIKVLITEILAEI